MAAGRTPADDEERSVIEASEEYRTRQPGALERHQLNTYIPFFRDRETVERVSLGFTDITAANVQAAPERVMRSLMTLNPMQRYAGIGCPTLIVHSELDPIPVEWSRLLATTIPGADYAFISNGSHFSMIEDAEALRDAVLPWLAKHRT